LKRNGAENVVIRRSAVVLRRRPAADRADNAESNGCGSSCCTFTKCPDSNSFIALWQVLTNESRIPARVTFLKPLSSAVSIGTGGPFGAEGPIIATGGALGSVLGQFLRVTAAERKTLLAAGAAAGMAATFGSPVSAVLLAVELLLFEYRPRSIIPVALAASGRRGCVWRSTGATRCSP
jgi:hypothetical protein